MKSPPEGTTFKTEFRFPFRSQSDDIRTLHDKFKNVSTQLNKLDGVEDVYYEEDEQWGLHVEVGIPVDSAVFHRPLRDVHGGIYKVLQKYYEIDKCY